MPLSWNNFDSVLLSRGRANALGIPPIRNIHTRDGISSLGLANGNIVTCQAVWEPET